MTHRTYYFDTQRRQATSTDTFTIKTPINQDSEFLLIHKVGVCNADNGSTRVEIGIANNSSTYYLETLVLTNNDYFYSTSTPFVVPNGWRIVIRVDSPNDEDNYIVNISGERISWVD